MTTPSNHRRLAQAAALTAALTAALVALLSGCGGGGGDSGGTGGPPPLSDALILTTANYTTAAQEALASAFFLGEAGSLATAAQTSQGTAIAQRAIDTLRRVTPRLTVRPPVATGVTVSETLPCTDGGNLRATIDDVNGNGDIDAGDSVAVVANACVEGADTLNGRITARFVALSGNLASDVFNATMTITLDQFSVAGAAGSTIGNGQMQVAIASTAANTATSTLTVSQLTTTQRFGSVTSTSTLSNARLQEATRPNGTAGFTTSTSVDGSFSSTSLESKSLTLATVTPFVQASTAAYPASGQATLSGGAGSKVRMTAQNSSTVLIELDSDGNGTYETSTTRTWESLI
ncbi:hypothetical protein [Ideonella sp. A 288]|uniref:hypothetical protein n=1 Tax=Ideonella sp. A 288 TaxID=1962181 RepID=UPI000B4A7EAA|nr:hypothetical protein [Ideonella sp. A 288]